MHMFFDDLPIRHGDSKPSPPSIALFAAHLSRGQWLRRWSPRLAEPGDHVPRADPLPALSG